MIIVSSGTRVMYVQKKKKLHACMSLAVQCTSQDLINMRWISWYLRRENKKLFKSQDKTWSIFLVSSFGPWTVCTKYIQSIWYFSHLIGHTAQFRMKIWSIFEFYSVSAQYIPCVMIMIVMKGERPTVDLYIWIHSGWQCYAEMKRPIPDEITGMLKLRLKLKMTWQDVQ